MPRFSRSSRTSVGLSWFVFLKAIAELPDQTGYLVGVRVIAAFLRGGG